MSRPQQSSSKHILFQRRKLGLSVEVISGSIEQSWVQLSLPSIQLTYFFLLNLETPYFSQISMLNIHSLIRLAKSKFLRGAYIGFINTHHLAMGKHLCWSFLARKKVAKKWYVADGTWYRFGENCPYIAVHVHSG